MVEEESEEKAAPAESPRRSYVLPACLALVVAVGAVCGVFLLRMKKEAPPAAVPKPAEQVVMIEDPDNVLTGAMIPLGSFVINLGRKNSFLKTTLIAECYEFEAGPLLYAKIPKFRDRVIDIASEKKPEELLTPTGKNRFRLDLIEAFNQGEEDESSKVVNVYFTDFVVQ